MQCRHKGRCDDSEKTIHLTSHNTPHRKEAYHGNCKKSKNSRESSCRCFVAFYTPHATGIGQKITPKSWRQKRCTRRKTECSEPFDAGENTTAIYGAKVRHESSKVGPLTVSTEQVRTRTYESLAGAREHKKLRSDLCTHCFGQEPAISLVPIVSVVSYAEVSRSCDRSQARFLKVLYVGTECEQQTKPSKNAHQITNRQIDYSSQVPARCQAETYAQPVRQQERALGDW